MCLTTSNDDPVFVITDQDQRMNAVFKNWRSVVKGGIISARIVEQGPSNSMRDVQVKAIHKHDYLVGVGVLAPYDVFKSADVQHTNTIVTRKPSIDDDLKNGHVLARVVGYTRGLPH